MSLLRERVLIQLIDELYDAAWRTEAWSPWLEKLGDALGGGAVALHLDFPRPDEPGWQATNPGLEATLSSYREHFASVDPHVAPMGHAVIGKVGSGEDIGIARTWLERSEFFNDFMRRNGMSSSSLGVVLETDAAGLRAGLGSFGLRPGRRYGKDAIELLSAITPHLQRAIRVAKQLRELDADRRALAGALDVLTTGVVLVDAKRRVIRTNRVAEAILTRADGLSVRDGRLCATRPADTAALEQRIERVGAAPAVDRAFEGYLSVARPSRRRSLLVLVAPLGTREREHLGARAIVLITDPEAAPSLPADALRAVFGLTHAEARLAVLLAGGATLREAADQLGMAFNTARHHLRNLLARTDTRRQSELVRLLTLGPFAIVGAVGPTAAPPKRAGG
jgi:DNA-binding CsgD family transcriptional regulator/PAS domain-containing protein